MFDLPPATQTDAGVTVRILPQAGYFNLRGKPDNAEFLAAASSALGQALPVDANTMGCGEHRIYWLGPDEWLIVTPLVGKLDLAQRLGKAIATYNAALTDVSGGQIALHISGPATKDILAKGCTLDFHPHSFAVGACKQSGLAKTDILIGLLDDQPTFEIVVRRSFAEYLVFWLQHSGREYGINFINNT